MIAHQDPFIAICESLRLHELTRYSTDELLAELKRRDSDFGEAWQGESKGYRKGERLWGNR